MRLTQYTDFSLRILIYLGLRRETLSTIQAISDAYGISKNHLMKVAQELARQGYIETVRGQGGGMRLKRPPEKIPLGQLIRDMEPDMELVECFRNDNQCVITPSCRLPAMLDRALKAFIREMDNYTLADLLGPSSPGLITLLDIPSPQGRAPSG